MARTSSRLGSAYLLAVPLAGVAVLAASAHELLTAPPPLAWVLLTALTAVTGAYTIKIPGLVVRLSVSEPTVFLSTFLFGPAAGALTAAVDAFVMSLRLIPRLRTLHRILFNVGTVAIAVYVAAQLYFRMAGLDTRRPVYGSIDTFVGPLYVFAGGVFAINSWLVAIALGIERAVSPFSIWRRQFLWLSATYLASASIAAILVAFTNTFNFALVGLLLPLVAVSFVAVRTTLGRLDDANQHLGEVNQLYLSTIETLAMAIDAKDQVTHGHIRRVQKFAVGLAQSLGMHDDRQLKAIEAAALLHDMGKLAIPEFILNKPGKLTASEFDVMKTHAALGADILSSIHFPYPVVPIVRHHHENWDGTGYPDGLKGSEIPIGARILSVVDCYDALTSDRPYRPSMSDDQAIEILTQRRGRMYDPFVVDEFVNALPSLKLSVGPDLLTSLPAIALPEHNVPAVSSLHDTPDYGAVLQSLKLLSAMAPFPAGRPARSVARDALSHIKGMANYDTSVIFLCDPTSLDLYPIVAEGSAQQRVMDLRIPLAERLTGWVAAYKTAVWNSDAALDLNPTRGQHDDLVVASALPLIRESVVVGVLSIYGRRGQDVSLAERRAIESTALPISEALWEAVQREPQAIEGRRPGVCAAALSALEGVLSYSSSERLQGTVLLTCLRAVASDGNRTTSIQTESALRLLVVGLLTNQPSRQCLVLSHGCLVLYDEAPESLDRIQMEVNSVMAASHLQPYSLEITRVTNSLDLQVLVRRVLDQTARDSNEQGGQRVH